jgi:hypothetical protein
LAVWASNIVVNSAPAPAAKDNSAATMLIHIPTLGSMVILQSPLRCKEIENPGPQPTVTVLQITVGLQVRSVQSK